MQQRHLWTLAMCALSASAPAMAQTLGAAPWRLCLTDQSVPPYLNAPGRALGLSEQLLRDAALRAGLSLVVQRQPASRCLNLLTAGKVDASLAGATDEWLKTVRFPLHSGKLDPGKRVVSLKLVWVKRKDSALDWDGRQLLHASPHNVRVGTLLVNQVATEALRPLGVVQDSAAYDAQQLLGKLALRRIDAAVLLHEEFEALRSTPAAQALVALPQPLRTADYYLAIKRQWTPSEQAAAEAWWAAIAALRDTAPYLPR